MFVAQARPQAIARARPSRTASSAMRRDSQLEGLGHADDARHVGGAGPAAFLLAAPVEQRADTGALAQVHEPDALGAVELVGAHGEHVDSQFVHVERQLACRLHGIDVEEHAGFAGDLAYLGDGLDGAHLVVGVHDRHQDGVGPDRLAHVFGIDEPAAVHWDTRDLVAALLQVLHAFEHSVVLDGGGDEMAPLLLLRVGGAQDGPVVGLGAAAREVDLLGLGADGLGDRLAAPSGPRLRR